MSASIVVNDSKFVIFGCGHDNTLSDSGLGERKIIRFFSHPFVPLGSVNYAGQYYIEVPDENGDYFDAVKDDMEHCTFDPPLGTTFDEEGEVVISITYERDYEIEGETLHIKREFLQPIEVVEHGTVVSGASANYRRDIYSDGYCFIRPYPDDSVISTFYVTYSMRDYPITKVSSLPWRANSLGRNIEAFIYGAYSSKIDLSELAYADVSNVTSMTRLFPSTRCDDWSFLEEWDVSSLRVFQFFGENCNIPDFSYFENWDTSSLENMGWAFQSIPLLTNLDGLENWDVSNVTIMDSTFANNSALTDLSALADWDVSNVTSLKSTFEDCSNLATLHGIENWDVSNVADMYNTFHGMTALTSLLPLSEWTPKPTDMRGTFGACVSLTSLKGVDNFDLSNCTTLLQTFIDCAKLLSIEGVENWDTSKVVIFERTFGNDRWVSDISPVANWSFASATSTTWMFGNVDAIRDVDDVIFDLSNITNAQNMFYAEPFGYSPQVNQELYKSGNFYYSYYGDRYAEVAITVFNEYSKDASNAENWTVSGTGLGAFSTNVWSNIPGWN